MSWRCPVAAAAAVGGEEHPALGTGAPLLTAALAGLEGVEALAPGDEQAAATIANTRAAAAPRRPRPPDDPTGDKQTTSPSRRRVATRPAPVRAGPVPGNRDGA